MYYSSGVGGATQITIANIYSAGSCREKKVIWEEVQETRRMQISTPWCVVGDFNSIRRLGERRSVNINTSYSTEKRRFNNFIEKMELLDIPMVGRKFTWYRPNGATKCRIDRILVLREWLKRWLYSVQNVLGRVVSDHCAFVLNTSSTDWAPKPLGV